MPLSPLLFVTVVLVWADLSDFLCASSAAFMWIQSILLLWDENSMDTSFPETFFGTNQLGILSVFVRNVHTS